MSFARSIAFAISTACAAGVSSHAIAVEPLSGVPEGLMAQMPRRYVAIKNVTNKSVTFSIADPDGASMDYTLNANDGSAYPVDPYRDSNVSINTDGKIISGKVHGGGRYEIYWDNDEKAFRIASDDPVISSFGAMPCRTSGTDAVEAGGRL